MRRTVFAAILALALHGVHAAEVAGVKLDENLRLRPAGPDLVLNGAGIRTRLIFKVYVAGLYLTRKTSQAGGVISLPGPKRVAMTLLRDLGAQQLSDALVEGIRNNATAAEQAAINDRLDQMLAIMAAIGEAKQGTRIALDYLPASGTRVVVNGKALGKPIPGADFYRALLKVWLGDNPVDDDLKRGMLGQPN
ncbi:MAG: hypothetical protein A3G25_21110 [Betaproteobacteria bacterium RIFCSPLOWO2_12_FULL_63_13]|nr:MAG: hypothetical protein A3H32_18910 [Betaproteobacteria bacterium RIFCSPLOWO2_02_FULL_63_19]OGA52075.1 MAG: hypothetical protein A3G25_21110 [Betaproteobacteria bacterium RIFCSPLOWO2_12_FULL_63_13]